jgi:hypothetical protein
MSAIAELVVESSRDFAHDGFGGRAHPPPRKRPGCAADDTPQLIHFQRVPASAAQSLLLVKGPDARVAAVILSRSWGVSHVA